MTSFIMTSVHSNGYNNGYQQWMSTMDANNDCQVPGKVEQVPTTGTKNGYQQWVPKMDANRTGTSTSANQFINQLIQ